MLFMDRNEHFKRRSTINKKEEESKKRKKDEWMDGWINTLK